jgi:hypothetical protein
MGYVNDTTLRLAYFIYFMIEAFFRGAAAQVLPVFPL